MYEVLLVIHTLIVLFLIGIILLQRSDGDGLSGLGGGGGNVLSGRASANIMTRTTAILATLFIVNSLALAILTSQRTHSSVMGSVMEEEGAATDAASTMDATEEKAPAAETPDAKTEKKVEKKTETKKAPSVPKPE